MDRRTIENDYKIRRRHSTFKNVKCIMCATKKARVLCMCVFFFYQISIYELKDKIITK